MTPTRLRHRSLRPGGLRDRAGRDRACRRRGCRRSAIASSSIRTCTTRWQRFSAADDERLAAIAADGGRSRTSTSPIAVRGGYGWSRLLDRLDFAALAAAGKRWMGHSDFTAFQLAALAHAGMKTFAGPMAAYDFGARDAVGVHARSLLGLARQASLRGGVRARRPRLRGRGHALGRQPRDGRAPRRHAAPAARRRRHPLSRGHRRASVSDRADALPAAFRGHSRAAARGAARAASPATSSRANDNGYDAAAMVAQVRARLGAPVYTGLPFGHAPTSSRCRWAAAAR